MCELFAFKEFSGRLGSSYYGTMTNHVVYSKTPIGCVVGHKVTIIIQNTLLFINQ